MDSNTNNNPDDATVSTQNSHQQQWSPMGGGSGDGYHGDNPSPATPYGQQQPPQQQQQQYTTPMSNNVYTPQAGTGSVTRFATPDMSVQHEQAYNNSSHNFVGGQSSQSPSGQVSTSASTSGGSGSYAARSTTMYNQNVNVQQPQQPQPPQQQQQQQQPSQASGGSYANRSAQAYQQQPQPPVQSAAGSSTSATTGGGYAARSAQAYGSQQQQYASQAQQQQSNNQYAPQQQQQQQMNQNQNQQAYTTPQQSNQQQQSANTNTSSGSYAARAAQLQQQQRPQQQQQQPQQQASGGSYATRSAQAYGGGGGPEASNTNQQQQQQQRQGSAGQMMPSTASNAPTPTPPATGPESPQAQAIQQRLLTDATRKVQEHAYYMRQAMDRKELPTVLDRAAHMVGELGGLAHGSHHHGSGGNSTSGSSSTSSAPSNTGASTRLTPKNYYELYMRALEDMPSFEEYLLNLVANPAGGGGGSDSNTIQIVASSSQQQQTVQRAPYTMRELYDCVQYCPRVLSRLYLQAAAGSALIRSGEVGAKWVLSDLVQAVKCEQNPIRGLFLRHFLLQVLRDKLPDVPPPPMNAPHLESIPSEEEVADDKLLGDVEVDERDEGTVKDSYEFILANFMEMNKLWVRIQHLPGEGKNKDVKKRRERERNELRILVGTNLVRLSQLECVTSKIYGEIILPQILDHIVVCGDPLSQAYLMDCLVQVFPDEYHIETLPILLNVCPRLRDKVNIRTILQGLMDRLANYLAEEELLDESDTNQVKKALARDSFGLFEESVQRVYNARGPKLTSREVIRLQTALLQFSLKCYGGNMNQVGRCLGVCVSALRQANVSYEMEEGTVASVPQERQVIKPLDEVSIVELEKLLSIPLDSLALKVLKLDHYGELISFLPWSNRRQVAVTLLQAVDKVGSTPNSVKEIEELFIVIEPVIRDEFSVSSPVVPHDVTARTTNLMAGLGVTPARPQSFGAGPSSFNETDPEKLKEAAKLTALVSKLVHLLDHEDTDTLYEMLVVARDHIKRGDQYRSGKTLVAVVFAALRLARRVFTIEQGPTKEEPKPADETTKDVEADVSPSAEDEESTPVAETGHDVEADAPMSAEDDAPTSTDEVTSAEEVDGEEKMDDVSRDTAEPGTEETKEDKGEAEDESGATGDVQETKAKTIRYAPTRCS